MNIEDRTRAETSMGVGIGYGLAAALVWGAWPVLSQLGVNEHLGAMDITALRFTISGVILLPLVMRKGTAGLGWGRAILLCAGAGVPYVLVMVGGLSYAPAAHAGVIGPSSMLVFSVLGSRLFLGETLTRSRLLGLSIVVMGGIIIGWENFGQEGLRGDLMFVCGGALWASYTVLSKAWSTDPLQATALVAVISMVLYLPVYMVWVGPDMFMFPTPGVLIQGLFQGVFASIFGLLFYSRSIVELGAAKAAVFAALVPSIAVVLAYPVPLGSARWRSGLTMGARLGRLI